MAVWVGAAGGPAGDGEQVVGDGEFVVGLVVGEAVGEGGAGAVVAGGVRRTVRPLPVMIFSASATGSLPAGMLIGAAYWSSASSRRRP